MERILDDGDDFATNTARKSCDEHVVRRYELRRNFDDITREWVRDREIGTVGLFRVLIPFGGEDTFPTDALKTGTKTTDLSKKINKIE